MTRGLLPLVLAPALLAAQQPLPLTFRGTAHAVDVNVTVFDGRGIVSTLGVDDFEIDDNGVRQTILAADFNRLPVDLLLVFDISGSISTDELTWYQQAMRQVVSALEPQDRCEIITFNARVAGAASCESLTVPTTFTRAGSDLTAFVDAMILALVTLSAPDRRQIAIVLSDALDTASFFSEETLLEVARRTEVVVYSILPGDRVSGRAVSVGRLEALSLLTRGRLVRTSHSGVPSAVIDALEEFRNSYLLYYSPTGVAIEGWHALDVRVRGGRGYQVLARKGYFGNQPARDSSR